MRRYFLDELKAKIESNKEQDKLMQDNHTPDIEIINPPEPYLDEEVINKYVNAFRRLLENNIDHGNIMRHLRRFDTEGRVEKCKEYYPNPAVIGSLALTHIVKDYYDVHDTYEDSWDRTTPASEVFVTSGYEQKELCYEFGILELTSKDTGKPLVIEITSTGMGSIFINILALEGSGEARIFLDLFHEMIEKYDIYKNKTFTLKQTNVGLSPHFIKPAEGVQNVVLSESIHTLIQSNILNIFEKADTYKQHNIPLKRGILFEGDPGCGKTSTVKYLESILQGKVTFMYVTDGAVKSAGAIGSVYDLARKYAPSVVVFEDIDTIGLTREVGNNGFTSELLAQLDGLELLEGVVTIATTNHPELIDNALKNRPSRFDRRIKLDVPNDHLRLQLFHRFMGTSEHSLTDEDWKQIVKATHNFSGAMIKEVLITAKIEQLHREIPTLTHEMMKLGIATIRENFYDDKKIGKNDKVGFR